MAAIVAVTRSVTGRGIKRNLPDACFQLRERTARLAGNGFVSSVTLHLKKMAGMHHVLLHALGTRNLLYQTLGNSVRGELLGFVKMPLLAITCVYFIDFYMLIQNPFIFLFKNTLYSVLLTVNSNDFMNVNIQLRICKLYSWGEIECLYLNF